MKHSKQTKHESGYPRSMVDKVEAAGWAVAQSTDGTGDWFAYWEYEHEKECILAWASSCETVEDIYGALRRTVGEREG